MNKERGQGLLELVIILGIIALIVYGLGVMLGLWDANVIDSLWKLLAEITNTNTTNGVLQ